MSLLSLISRFRWIIISPLVNIYRNPAGELQFIRPLVLLTNKDTAEFANIRKYPSLKQAYPFEDTTKRTTARELIQQLEKIHPKARLNLFKSMGNIDEEYLP